MWAVAANWIDPAFDEQSGFEVEILVIAGGDSSGTYFACIKTIRNNTVENFPTTPTKEGILQYRSRWSCILIDQPDKTTSATGIRRARCSHRQNAGRQAFGKGKKDNRGKRRGGLRLCSPIEMCGFAPSQQLDRLIQKGNCSRVSQAIRHLGQQYRT